MPYIPKVKLENYEVSPEVISMFEEDTIRRLNVMPLFRLGDVLTVAVSNPGDISAIDELQRQSKMTIDLVLAQDSAIKTSINDFFGTLNSIEDVLSTIGDDDVDAVNEFEKEEIQDIEEGSESTPVINLVNMLLNQAINDKASDIHISPTGTESIVKYRLDGKLSEIRRLPKRFHSPVTSRIKVMAQLDIAKSRVPQDGQARIIIRKRTYDLRVSTLPTVDGENVVIRVLDKSNLSQSLDALGLPALSQEKFEKIIKIPYGMILVTGPTGSGKTTTLYTVLESTKDPSKNLITLEDPVEYQMPFIRQVQVNAKAGLTFSEGLRSILRQDPDIVLVGEIRDLETASLAVRASLTGHLVYSTLHTNDSPSALGRLMDMGLEPFLVSSAVTAVLNQRLVRKICENCKQEFVPEPELIDLLKLSGDQKYFRGTGCDRCNGIGFKGRVGVFELMVVTDSIKEEILKKSSVMVIKDLAIKEGMITLKEGILEKVREGVTSPEEAISITQFIG